MTAAEATFFRSCRAEEDPGSFEQTCPTCQGCGEIRRTRRRGVAVFPRRVGEED